MGVEENLGKVLRENHQGKIYHFETKCPHCGNLDIYWGDDLYSMPVGADLDPGKPSSACFKWQGKHKWKCGCCGKGI